MSSDKAPRGEVLLRVIVDRSARPDRFARNPPAPICRKNPDAPAAPAHRERVCPWPYPERASKFGSSRDPFFQTDVHDLPLFLGRQLQFGCFIIVQPAPQNLQDFAGGFSRRANNKNPPELLLVLAIAPLQRHLYGIIGRRSLLLFLRRPRRRLCCRIFFRACLADSRMTPERFEPIRFAEAAPNFIRNRKKRGLFVHRPVRGHARRPSFRTAAGKNLASSFLVRQPIPPSEHLAHAFAPSAASLSRNSATRLPATAARYREVDRISSMGLISCATLFLAVSINDGSILFPKNACSVSVKRNGMGATLPSARRTSRIVPFAIWPKAARQTLERATHKPFPRFAS